MSDDPVAARRIATIGTKQASMTAWSSNVNAASALVSQADGVMKSVSDLMSRARELTIAATSDTANPADRATIPPELRTIGRKSTRLITNHQVAHRIQASACK